MCPERIAVVSDTSLSMSMYQSCSNHLQMNSVKTEVLWLTTRRHQHQLPQSMLRDGADLGAPTAIVQNLSIFIDTDISMRSHVMRTVSSFFAILWQLRCIQQSVPRTVLQSLMSSLVLSRLDYGNAILSGISGRLIQGLHPLPVSRAWR